MLEKLLAFLRGEPRMTKLEFLESLEKVLADIPYIERREALDYYKSYFDESECTDEEVIQSLGNPQQVASSIREDLQGKELAVIDGIEAKSSDQKDMGLLRKGLTIYLVNLFLCCVLPLWPDVCVSSH